MHFKIFGLFCTFFVSTGFGGLLSCDDTSIFIDGAIDQSVDDPSFTSPESALSETCSDDNNSFSTSFIGNDIASPLLQLATTSDLSIDGAYQSGQSARKFKRASTCNNPFKPADSPGKEGGEEKTPLLQDSPLRMLSPHADDYPWGEVCPYGEWALCCIGEVLHEAIWTNCEMCKFMWHHLIFKSL